METFLTNLVVKITGSKKDCEENRGEIFIVIFSQLSSGDASDSICPKGWGIAKNNGDGSYQKLIRNVFGANIANKSLIQNYREYNTIRPDEILLQALSSSILHSSDYGYASGIFNYNPYGNYWLNKTEKDKAYRLVSFYNYLYPQSVFDKGQGFSLRCVAKFFR